MADGEVSLAEFARISLELAPNPACQVKHLVRANGAVLVSTTEHEQVLLPSAEKITDR